MNKLKSGVFVSLFFAALAARAGDGPTSRAELQRLYRQFFQQKNGAGLRTLVYWRGVGQQNRAGFLRSVSKDFKYHLRDIQFLPLQPDEHLEYTLKGVTYMPALPPVGRMIVRYDGQGNAEDLSTSYLIGTRKGRYYIDLAVKKIY